ncbi:MAG: hypothetical protein IJW73_04420 [Candidatus Gastranaerophilales bacterium]|nr:hypothetical protein [Candidatus Gastranaerophilales bacterium]
MKKSAFSYLELIICMTVVVSAIMLSAPLLTGNPGGNSDIFGEFRCFSEYDELSKGYKLYQQERYNSQTLSAKKEVDECIFTKPVGANSYTITLSGGGGGGASAAINKENLNFNQIKEIELPGTEGALPAKLGMLPSEALDYVSCSGSSCTYKHTATGFEASISKFKNKKMQRVIDVYPGMSGSAGDVITKTSSLVNNFNIDDSIKITLCKNGKISSTDAEERYCVGEGGMGGKAVSLGNYYTVVGILQDLVRAHKFPTQPYVGLGDGKIDNYDLVNLKNAVSSTDSAQPYVKVNNYVNSRTEGNFLAAYNALSQILNLQRTVVNPNDSDGHDGEYSRFLISDSENLIANGGKGARTSQNIEHIFDKSGNDKQDFQEDGSYTFYVRKGEDGKYNSKVYATSGGAGGYCSCSGYACTNCNGNNGKDIGAGGGGGSIAFKSREMLNIYETTSFFLRNSDQELGSEYNVGDKPLPHKFEPVDELDEIYHEQYYSGAGGNGGGGAIIINW